MPLRDPTKPPLKRSKKEKTRHSYSLPSANLVMDIPPPQAAANKHRVMVSYGGRIVPVPHKLKSLFYAGGETRLISVPAFIAATFSTFSSHIAAVLQVGYPFSLKYQLPLHDLDSLISLSTDEDLYIFLEELERFSSSPSPAPSRIRLFLFPIKQQLGGDHVKTVSGIGAELTQTGLTHPKTESWFVDALKSAKMMQQKREMGGFGGEGGQSEGLCGQESMMLETTSSFGSSSSSVSFSNLPLIKAGGDETMIHYQDNKTMMPSIESTTCDIGIMASPVSYAQTVTYQDPFIPVVAMENKVSLNPIELSDNKTSDLVPPGLPMHKTVQVAGPGYLLSTQLDQLQQQSLQFVQMSNPMSVLPVTYPTHNMMPPHQPIQYLPNQPYPVYAVPVGQAQAYNASPQYCSKETMPVVSGRPPLLPNTPAIAYKEVAAVPTMPGFVSQAYRTTPVANSPVHMLYNEVKQQNVVVPQMHNQPLPISVTSGETANYSNEHDDEAARSQIYKSQPPPPPPTLPSQYQTMTNARTVLLS
ncbi:hypothetical protein Ddye_012176 [Dipteronia dyeriana]|uniref:PB1 domain-containing protein n=1 Tax=Dipteronia dyeriana TaxID=168575 RepID=A0AAD9X3T7_9ROSI|nr:hypothetical protein Ddye_012176 [Dipteronia dyeriana]